MSQSSQYIQFFKEDSNSPKRSISDTDVDNLTSIKRLKDEHSIVTCLDIINTSKRSLFTKAVLTSILVNGLVKASIRHKKVLWLYVSKEYIRYASGKESSGYLMSRTRTLILRAATRPCNGRKVSGLGKPYISLYTSAYTDISRSYASNREIVLVNSEEYEANEKKIDAQITDFMRRRTDVLERGGTGPIMTLFENLKHSETNEWEKQDTGIEGLKIKNTMFHDRTELVIEEKTQDTKCWKRYPARHKVRPRKYSTNGVRRKVLKEYHILDEGGDVEFMTWV